MKLNYCILTLLLLPALAGCYYDEERTVYFDRPVEAAFTLSVQANSSSASRMSGEVTQAGGNFRGLQDLWAIPFATQGKISSTDRPKAFDTEGLLANEYSRTTSQFYFFEGCHFMTGVSSFLVYGRARATLGADGRPLDKVGFGSVVANIPATAYPDGISFVPESIYDDVEAPEEANAIADYLTTVANAHTTFMGRTYTWRAAADTKLRTYHQNFVGQRNESTALLASSTANVKMYVGALREQIFDLHYEAGTVESLLRSAILDAIDAGYDQLPANYPASINLPDGAAVVRWDGVRFQPQTTTTTLANVSSIRRYAYPAELYYFANSQIKTSTQDNRHDYYDSESTWNSVLSQYEQDNGVVTNNTTAVAIKEPLKYAVASLQVWVKPHDTTTLADADGRAVSISNSVFPLTGIIVGSQRPVGFDFVPLSDSDVDTRFIYDSNPSPSEQLYLSANGSTATTNTLVLQTCDGEDVTFIVEFQNNSSYSFRCLDGLVYPGTRFYLAGKIESKDTPDNEYAKRAFTKDYTTRVGITIASLAKAYNAVPDILSPKLELGVELTPQWTMTMPSIISLNGEH